MKGPILTDEEDIDRLVRGMQDSRKVGDDELCVHGKFRAYTVFNPATKRNEELSTPPDVKPVPKKEGVGSFPGKLEMSVSIDNMNEVNDMCKVLHDGTGWRAKVKLTYGDKPDNNARQWLLDNYQSFYSGNYTGQFPIGEFVSQDGTFATSRWITINRKDIIKFKASSAKEGIFHRKKKASSGYQVCRRTGLIFFKCIPEQFVALREIKPMRSAAAAAAPAVAAASPDAPSVWTPVCYTSIVCKGGSRIADDNNSDMPESESYHATESKDAHNMIPVARLLAGEHIQESVYFWVAKHYQTMPVPCTTGVTIDHLAADNDKDFFYSFQEQTTIKCTFRLKIFQWYHDPGTEAGRKHKSRERYAVKIFGSGTLWREFGITDSAHYVQIMLANHQLIPCHVDAMMRTRSIMDDEHNSATTMSAINAKIDTHDMCGFYEYDAKAVVPDYLRFFHKDGQRVSRAFVERIFKKYFRKDDDDNRVLHLTPVQTARNNPLHTAELFSPVIALGNPMAEDPQATRLKPLYHAFEGDVYPVFEESDFYVLTSYTMTFDERCKYCGPGAAAAIDECDKFMDSLIEKKVAYWVFAVKRSAIPAKVVDAVLPAVPEEPVQQQQQQQPPPSIVDDEEVPSTKKGAIGKGKKRKQ